MTTLPLFFAQIILLGWIVESFLGALGVPPALLPAVTALLALAPLLGTGPLMAFLLNPLDEPGPEDAGRLRPLLEAHGLSCRTRVAASPFIFSLSWASFLGARELIVSRALLGQDDGFLEGLVKAEGRHLRRWDAPIRTALLFYPAALLAVAGKLYLAGTSVGATFFPGLLALVLYYPVQLFAALHSRLAAVQARRFVDPESGSEEEWELAAALSLARLCADEFPWHFLALRDYLPWDSLALHRAAAASHALPGEERVRMTMALAAQRRVTPLVDLLFSRGLAGTRYELPSLFSSLLWNLLPLWCFLLGLAGVLWGRLYIAAPFFLFALGHAGKTLLDYPPWRKPCEELPEAQGEWAVPALLRGVAAKEPPLRGYGLIWIEKAGRFYPARMRGLFDVLSPGTPLSLTALAGQAVTAKGYFRWRGFPVLDVTELVAPDGRRIRSRHLLWQLLWSSAMAGAALFHMILQRMESP